MQQPNTIATMFDIIGQAMKPYTELMELAAIHLGKVRFAPRDQVAIEKGLPVKVVFHPTHRIVKCMGTIDSVRMEMHLENLETNESLIIKL